MKKIITLIGLLSISLSTFAHGSFPPLCVGDQVINSDGSARGTVQAIYPNGMVSIAYPAGSFTQDPKTLGRTKGEVDGLHIDDRVINADSSASGTVEAIYLNGLVDVNYENTGSFIQDPNKLGRAKGEVNGLHIGDQVINSDGSARGTVQAIYPNGMVSVAYPAGSFTQDPTKLGRVSGCTDVSSCLRR